MPEAGGRLNLPDPRREMMVCYSGAENQSLPVRKKRLKGGEPVAVLCDALIEPPVAVLCDALIEPPR